MISMFLVFPHSALQISSLDYFSRYTNLRIISCMLSPRNFDIYACKFHKQECDVEQKNGYSLCNMT
uniref:Uncharacterized protein n=1 Tax=Anguilla anguilla TaxID=7936 RepID=A0A0E9WXN5_ANGAN